MNLLELLGLPPTMTKPNAYELLGLESGEGNEEILRAAVARAQSRLQASRSKAPPEVWDKAAKTIEQAGRILLNPSRREEYDAKLGLSPVGAGATAWDASFARWLPAGDPAQAFDIVHFSERPPADPYELFEMDLPSEFDPTEPSVSHSEWHTDHSEHSDETESFASATSAPVRLPKRRRRGLPIVPMFVALLVLGMFGGISYCVYLLVNQPKGQQVASNDHDTVMPETPVAPQTPATEKKKPVDPIMGNLIPGADTTSGMPPNVWSPQQEAPQVTPPVNDPPANTPPMNNTGVVTNETMVPAVTPKPTEPDPNMVNPGAPSLPPSVLNAPPSTPPTMPMLTPDPAPTPPGPTNPAPDSTTPAPSMPEPTAEEIAAGEQILGALRQRIAQQRWMLSSALVAKMTEGIKAEAQRKEADALDRLVTYAREYDQFIRQGADKWGATESIEMAPGQPIVKVESNAERLVIRASGKNRTFLIKELPLVIADPIANLAADKTHPTTLAFRAAYRFLSISADGATRRESIQAFQQMASDPSMSEEVDVSGMAEAAEKLSRMLD